MAAYVIPEDAWYIIPTKAIRGMSAICLCSTMPKYEQYREARQLLKKAGYEDPEEVSEAEEVPAGAAVARMQDAMNYFRNYLVKGGR